MANANKLVQFGEWMSEQGVKVLDAAKATGQDLESAVKSLGQAIQDAIDAGTLAGGPVGSLAKVLTGTESPQSILIAMGAGGPALFAKAIDKGMRAHASQISVGGRSYSWSWAMGNPGWMMWYLSQVAIASPKQLGKAFGVAGLDATDDAMDLDAKGLDAKGLDTMPLDLYGADDSGANAGADIGGTAGEYGADAPQVTDPTPLQDSPTAPTPPTSQPGSVLFSSPGFIQGLLTVILGLANKIAAFFHVTLPADLQPPTVTPPNLPPAPASAASADSGPSLGMLLIVGLAIYYAFFDKPKAKAAA